MRNARPLLAAATLLAATFLAGCAVPPPANTEIRTASDQTDADRRARVRLELASAYFGRGQTETALDEIKQALAADPNLAAAYSLRGLIYASLSEPALAADSFRRALQLGPRDGDILHNYGWFLCQQQRWDEAQAHFERAIAQPQYAQPARSWLALGVCQARAQRWDAAERSLARSYELDPANPATAVNLSEVLLRRGELERARFYVRRVNQQPEYSNAQTLWLAARIEHRLGNRAGVEDFGRQLRNRFPQAPQTLALERGQFND